MDQLIARLSRRCGEKLPWFASWTMLNATPARASPSESTSRPACHQVPATKTRATHDATSHASMKALFA